MFFDAPTNTFVPRYAGKVEGIRGEEVLVNGEWQALGWPWWTNEEDALKACEGSGPVMPSIK
jgi:hypothetical protein